MIKKFLSVFLQLGFDIRKTYYGILFLPKYLAQLIYFLFKSRSIKVKVLYPQLLDWKDSSGTAEGHYFHQDIIVARWIYEASPKRHVDYASRVDGFISHLAVFRQVEVHDIRSLKTNENNIVFKQIDITKEIINDDEKIESVSCLHSIEHFGLGRYTDTLDVDGHLKGFNNIISKIANGGCFYFSVPLGPLRIEFNAHRVFSVEYILTNFIKPNNLKVEKCCVINDHSEILMDLTIEDGLLHNWGCIYGLIILKLKN